MPYPYKTEIPALVQRAYDRAVQIGFPVMLEGRPIGYRGPATTIIPEDGALLRMLAATHRGARIGEIGTGAGVSTAWLLSGMSDDSFLLTCDIEVALVTGVQEFFKEYPNVKAQAGDWQQLFLSGEPFDLLFFDATPRIFLQHRSNWDDAIKLIKVGGQIVMDDLAPVDLWPSEWAGTTDHKREFVLFNSRIAGVEVRTTARTASLVGTRIY